MGCARGLLLSLDVRKPERYEILGMLGKKRESEVVGLAGLVGLSGVVR